MFEFSEDALNEICASLKKTKERQEKEASIYKMRATAIISLQAKDKKNQLLVFAKNLTNYAQEIEVKRKKFLEVNDRTKKIINSTNSMLREKGNLLSITATTLMAINTAQINVNSKNLQNANTTNTTSSALAKYLKSIIQARIDWIKDTGASNRKVLISGVLALVSGQDPKYVLVKSAINLTIQNYKTNAKLVKETTSALIEFGKEAIPKVGEAITGAVKVVGKATKSVLTGIKNAAIGLYEGAKKAVTGAKKVVDTVTKSVMKGVSVAADIIAKGLEIETKILNTSSKVMSGVNTVVSAAATIANTVAVITGATEVGPVISLIATGLKTASTALSLATSVVTGAAKVTQCKSEILDLLKTRIESGEKITLKTIAQDTAKVATAVGSAVVGVSTAIISITKLPETIVKLTDTAKNLGDMSDTAMKLADKAKDFVSTKTEVIKDVGKAIATGAKKVTGFVFSLLGKK